MRRSAAFLSALAGAMATSNAALAQTLGTGADADIPWLRLGAALLLCLGLATGAAFALNHRLGGPVRGTGLARLLPSLTKLGGVGPAPRLSDIETRRLSTNVTVSVFRCDGRSFMVTASTQGHLVLVSLEEPSGEEP